MKYFNYTSQIWCQYPYYANITFFSGTSGLSFIRASSGKVVDVEPELQQRATTASPPAVCISSSTKIQRWCVTYIEVPG